MPCAEGAGDALDQDLGLGGDEDGHIKISLKADHLLLPPHGCRAGHAKFPQQIYECKAAIRWLRANVDKFDLDADNFTFWGASAGGHLSNIVGATSGTSILEGDLGDNLRVSSAVQKVVSWYAPSDLLQMKTKLITIHSGCTLFYFIFAVGCISLAGLLS